MKKKAKKQPEAKKPVVVGGTSTSTIYSFDPDARGMITEGDDIWYMWTGIIHPRPKKPKRER